MKRIDLELPENYQNIFDKDPVELIEPKINISWKPSRLINGKATDASVEARVYQTDDGRYLVIVEESRVLSMSNFSPDELRQITDGATRLAQHDQSDLDWLGPFGDLSAAINAAENWQPAA